MPVEPARLPSDTEHVAFAFGLCWRADIALTSFHPQGPETKPCVQVRRVARLAERRPLASFPRGHVHADGIRFDWEREVSFDMYDGDRIDYSPGPDWTGALPAAFFGTVAALVAAWRGSVPLHACTVEIDGKAVLVAGPAGAGKSSMTAALLSVGARFVADDLSVIVRGEGGKAYAQRGRTTMRLFRDTAEWIDADDRAPVPDDPRGKWVVRPRHRSSAGSMELGGLLLLGGSSQARDSRTRGDEVMKQLFRPRWLGALPPDHRPDASLIASLSDLPMLGFPAARETGFAHHSGRARAAMALIRLSL